MANALKKTSHRLKRGAWPAAWAPPGVGPGAKLCSLAHIQGLATWRVRPLQTRGRGVEMDAQDGVRSPARVDGGDCMSGDGQPCHGTPGSWLPGERAAGMTLVSVSGAVLLSQRPKEGDWTASGSTGSLI